MAFKPEVYKMWIRFYKKKHFWIFGFLTKPKYLYWILLEILRLLAKPQYDKK